MTTSTGAAEAPRRTPAFMVALIEQDRARRAAAERDDAQRASAAAEQAWLSRAGSRNTSSAVFTLRLGREESRALHREASMRSLPPSVLARRVRSAALHPAPSTSGARAPD